MPRLHRLTALAFVAASAWMLSIARPAPAADDKPAAKAVDFKKEIEPIFKASCIKCHSQPPANAPGGGGPGGGPGGRPRGPAAGFRLDDKAAALKGGKAGNDIVPGKSADSLLFKLLSGPVAAGDKDIAQMPKGMRNQPAKPLTPQQIELIKDWIDQGAKWGD